MILKNEKTIICASVSKKRYVFELAFVLSISIMYAYPHDIPLPDLTKLCALVCAFVIALGTNIKKNIYMLFGAFRKTFTT